MKREFGKRLIEEYLPTVNLDLVINTSGAYIPGHGTPTVLLFGSAEKPEGTDLAVVLSGSLQPAANSPAAKTAQRAIVPGFMVSSFVLTPHS